MNTNETVSPAGGKVSADYVCFLFRCDVTPVIKMIWTAVVMQIIFFGPILVSILGAFLFPQVQILQNILFLIAPPILVSLVFPFIPGIIVRRRLMNDVIPACRNSCSEKEIVSGAFQCLRFMWGRYILCLLPAILAILGIIVYLCAAWPFKTPFILLLVPVFLIFLLGECALAVFPVARIFSRRAGMIVMFPFIIPGQIVMILDYLIGASGFLYFTDGDVPIREYTNATIIIFLVCAALFGGALAYFIHAAKKDTASGAAAVRG
jgi:hypothetical protein